MGVWGWWVWGWWVWGWFLGFEVPPVWRTGLVNGNRFAPLSLTVWLVRVVDGQDPAQPTQPRFADVGADRWWAGHVERLAQLGTTLGCSTEPLEYCPDRPVTRAQMASFLVRAFEIPAAEAAGFEDTSHNYHAADIDALAAARITLGCDTDPPRFCPQEATTRAQMASFLTRAITTRQTGSRL